MNLPPFLLGATIIFWGWQTGFWLIAIPIAVMYELSSYINWRWNLTTADFRNASHLCTIMLVGVLIYLLIDDRSLGLIFDFFQWLPAICLPLLIAQTYSTSDRVDLNALLFFKDKPNRQQLFYLDLTYPYFAICILAASAANTRDSFFYIGVVLLIGTALIPFKSRRFSSVTFSILLILAIALGMAGHLGIHQLQQSLTRKATRFFYGFYRPHTDPNQVSTAIGDLGSVKRSNKIVLRVKPESEAAPQLLRRAVYNRYSSGFWVAAKPEFVPVKSSQSNTTWILADNAPTSKHITVSENMEEGSTLLKLPVGSYEVERFPVAKIQQNQYGTVQVYSDESFLSYGIKYNSALSQDSLPREEDLQVVDVEKPALDRIITQLDLNHQTPQDILTTVNRFFNTEFNYSLELARQGQNRTPLSAFLEQHRSGHCEYFATATALLLRRVGIPSRYVVGYSVHEFSQLEDRYIVRSRNAHAWTQVYIDGNWQTFDPTPASWIAFEDRQTSSWQDIKDIFSWLRFQLNQTIAIFKALGREKYLWLLVIPLGVILIRQFTVKEKKRRLTAIRTNRANVRQPVIGEDSELYLIERELSKLGLQRDRTQTWQVWLERLQDNATTLDLAKDLEPIIELHYRYCFDPQGITLKEREKLRSWCYSWLKKHHQISLDAR